MTIHSTAGPGIALAVIAIVLMVAALVSGEARPRGRAARILAGGGLVSALACVALIAVRFTLAL